MTEGGTRACYEEGARQEREGKQGDEETRKTGGVKKSEEENGKETVKGGGRRACYEEGDKRKRESEKRGGENIRKSIKES